MSCSTPTWRDAEILRVQEMRKPFAPPPSKGLTRQGLIGQLSSLVDRQAELNA